ncbi:MAG: bifunctional phosphoribosylaminoimidazolecarboxamide formyltransferase/IMP cyclohydrolase [Candidatus Omnitrophica bacterium]|jgi:phosphoribosylaminoimidazolecarboxamide formyltransferase/IMP cyclohydrolase|nr:bifunctional phosphoribosylaminoimidazolecarboxamide formyltransferase/IMP cyclohydrolase [Candidatus Omnitrophota bacterium]MDD5079967.1 bifunctional phosphoribosylaminoimidazolecarboxamide formyltransferase/IMP cyclohydrolase [Candidatus Omnitrophota bacterium]
MIKIKRALVSVSDKTGIIDLCKTLNKFKVEILSTGGTAKIISQNNIPVTEVSDYTGFPEMLDGRVKTLHPKIHGGLLALRENPEHMKTLKLHDIGLIDMVVVNLYPFEKTVSKPDVTRSQAIENIDIGGPSMLRSAAKNHQSVAVVSDPQQYPRIIEELEKNGGGINESSARELAEDVFKSTSRYDGAIYNYLSATGEKTAGGDKFPKDLRFDFVKVQGLRYGENPHQSAAFYAQSGSTKGLGTIKQLWGKELSFNNILDLNAAVNIAREFSGPAVVFLKHNNPCGVAENRDLLKAYKDAWNCDRLSAFGGVLSINRKVDMAVARLIAKSGFLECVITPAFSPDALGLLKAKKNLRLLEMPRMLSAAEGLDLKRVDGGLLAQDPDKFTLDENNLKVVTKKKVSKKDLESLIFAWKVAKHVKSNAIILSRGTKTVGIGAGQMSRVDSVFITKRKAGKLTKNSCMASDAFFPKDDAVIEAAKMGVRAIIQPGGSIADTEIIKACDKYKVAMVFTGIRHFRH